ncbi:MAG: DnaJ C-terminal domain-containing protein [Deltaproteobacteria bacterium]
MARTDDEIYAALGVARDADEAAVKKAYRALAMKLHPDRNPDDAAARARWGEINQAYAAYTARHAARTADPTADTNAPAGGGPGVPFDTASFDDIFKDFFGAVPLAGLRPDARRGGDLRMALLVSEGDALSGVRREVIVDRQVLCVPCAGTGALRGELRSCSTCGGSGKKSQTPGVFAISSVCAECRGRGRLPVKACAQCVDGLCARRETIRVTVPPGVSAGQMLRIGEKGNDALGGVPGSLYLALEIEPSGNLARKGADAVVEVVVRARQLMLGGPVSVATLDGSTTIRVPRGVRDGTSLRLPGKGHVHAGERGADPSSDPYRGEPARGDQLVVFRVPPDVAACRAALRSRVPCSQGSQSSSRSCDSSRDHACRRAR